MVARGNDQERSENSQIRNGDCLLNYFFSR